MAGRVALWALVILAAKAPSSSAQADGKFWWQQRPSGDSVLPATIPPAASAPRRTPSTPPGEAATARPQTDLPAATVARGDEASCVCVDYYLCDSNGFIITTGEGLVDVRGGRLGAPCDGIQVCCNPPRKAPTTTTTTTTTESALYQADECGIRGGDLISNMVDVRILDSSARNGSTEFAEFPWTLVLLKSDEAPTSSSSSPSASATPREKNVFVCGASLVHPRVAMTAAHCIAKKKVQELKIRAGEWDTQQMSEALPHQDRKVARMTMHPGFYEGTLYNDVALLFLESPFQLARNVRPICLPNQGEVFDGSRCIATGWGRNAFGRNGTYQMTMKMVELPVVPHARCQDKLRETRLSQYFNLHETFVCAGGERGRDTCQGDGGGPLVCRSPHDSGRYVQLGITSWGIGCGDTDVPAVYANVPSFADWVTSELAKL